MIFVKSFSPIRFSFSLGFSSRFSVVTLLPHKSGDQGQGIAKHLARLAFATVTGSALGSLSSVALSSDSAFTILIDLQPVCKAKNSDKKNLSA